MPPTSVRRTEEDLVLLVGSSSSTLDREASGSKDTKEKDALVTVRRGDVWALSIQTLVKDRK